MNYNHLCTLETTQRPVKKQYKWVQKLIRLTKISMKNPRTKFYFKSIALFEKEKKRLDDLNNSYIIHPFSVFRIYWELVFVFIFFASLLFNPISMTIKRSSLKQSVSTWDLYAIDRFDLFLDFLSMCDIVVTLITGYWVKKTQEVILSPKGIIRAYMRSCEFYRDLLSSLPLFVMGCILCHFYPTLLESKYIVYLIKLTCMFKLLRIYKCLKYFNNIAETVRHQYYQCTLYKYIALLVIVIHWMTCLYAATVTILMSLRDLFIVTSDSKQNDQITIYLESLYKTASYLLGINLSRANKNLKDKYNLKYETVVVIVYSIIGYVFSNVGLVLTLQMVMSMNSYETKYYSILFQLKQYMTHKDLSKNMKDRMLSYYDYRFQKKYFSESTIEEMLSENLRRDINLFSCRTLIESVSLLRDLHADIIAEVVNNLKREVFLYNDVIVKAGFQGDCMYFIANGTVSVSTTTGKEICHLQDGAYFGEIALIYKDQKRIANVIAIEFCEIYRLDRRNFKACFMNNSVHYKKIAQVAQERMEKTLLLEQLHKKYIIERTSKRIREDSEKRNNEFTRSSKD